MPVLHLNENWFLTLLYACAGLAVLRRERDEERSRIIFGDLVMAD